MKNILAVSLAVFAIVSGITTAATAAEAGESTFGQELDPTFEVGESTFGQELDPTFEVGESTFGQELDPSEESGESTFGQELDPSEESGESTFGQELDPSEESGESTFGQELAPTFGQELAPTFGPQLAPIFGSKKKGCFCKLRTSCRGRIMKNFGKVASYGHLEFNKKGKCANACNQATARAKPGLLGSRDAFCKQLSNGFHTLQSYSVVGAKDNNANTCQADFTMPLLRCATHCGCPAGMGRISIHGFGKDMCYDQPNQRAIPLVCSLENEWLP